MSRLREALADGARVLSIVVFLLAAATAWFCSCAPMAHALTRAATPATLASVDATVQAGDVVHLAAGSYAACPSPASAGVTYIGDLAHPERVSVSGPLAFARDRVTLKGFSTTTGGISIPGSLRGDSLAFCLVDCPSASLYLGQAEGAVLYGNRINVSRVRVECLNGDCRNGARPRADVVRRNTISVDFASANDTPMSLRGLTVCTVDSNRWTERIRTNVAGDAHFRMMYHCNGSTFRDNHWVLRNDNPGRRYAVDLRDSCRGNLVERDTIEEDTTGVGIAGVYLATSGSYPGTCGYNVFRALVVHVRGEGLAYQDATNRDSILDCDVTSWGGNAFLGLAPTDSTTIIGSSFTATRPRTYRGAYRQEGAAPTARTILGCLFVTAEVSSTPSEYAVCYYSDQTTGLRQDGNLFWSPAGPQASSRAVGFGALTYSGVGAGTPWALATGQDTHSSFGPPATPDHTPPAPPSRLSLRVAP